MIHILSTLRRLLPVLLLCGLSVAAGAQTVVPGALAGAVFCPGNSSALPFTATGTFGAGNVFTAQISDSAGSFANPVAVGTLAATASGTIPVQLPAGLHSGSGYQVRIVSSNPALTSAPAGAGFRIAPGAVVNNPGALYTCVPYSYAVTSYTFSGTGSSYNWSINGPLMGIQPRSGVNQFNFIMEQPGYSWQVTASPNGAARGTIAISNSDAYSMFLYDAVTYQPLTTIYLGEEVYDASINPAGTKAVTYATGSNHVFIVDLASRSLAQTVTTPASVNFNALAYSADGNIVYVGLSNGQIAGYNVHTGAPVITIAAPGNGLSPINIRAAADGQRLFVLYGDPRVLYMGPSYAAPQSVFSILNAATGAVLLSTATEDYAIQLRADPNGSQVFVNSANTGAIRAHSSSTGAQLGRIVIGSEPATGFAVGSNGLLYAMCNYLRVYSTTSYNYVTDAGIYGTSITLSNDASMLYVIVSSNGPVGAYSANNYTLVGETEQMSFGITADNDFVNIVPVTCAGPSISFPMYSVAPATASISYPGGPFCTSGGTISPTRTGLAGGRYTAPNGLAIDSVSGVIDLAASQQGTYVVTYTALNPGCGIVTDTAHVQVYATVATSISYPGSPYCSSTGTGSVFFSGFNGGTYSASSAGLSLNAATGDINIAASQPGTYTVTYTANNGACTIIATAPVTIRPALGAITDNRTFCGGTTTTPIGFGNVAGLSYYWTNSNPAIGLAASGTDFIPSFNALNNGTQNATADIRLYASGGTGCSVKGAGFRIVVKPEPTVNEVPDQNLCAGFPASVTFTGNATTLYAWTNSNPAIGLAAAGSNGISFNPANNSGSLQTGTVTVTPSANGCAGTPRSFAVTVAPSAGTISYPQSSYCPSAWAYVRRTGSAGGVYSVVPSGLMLNSADGSINLAASAPGTYTITYTVAAAGSCQATASTTLTVKPLAAATALSNPVFCAGESVASIAFLGNSSSYSWTNSNGAIGLAASGTGAALPAFTAANAGTTPLQAQINVTPLGDGLNTCPGRSIAFRITVNPIPSVDPVTAYSPVFCRNSGINPVTFTGPVAGTTYYWSATTTSVGLQTASGVNTVDGFLAANPTSGLLTSTLIVRPVAAKCAGAPLPLSIRVDDCTTTPPNNGRLRSVAGTDFSLSPNPAIGQVTLRYNGAQSGPFRAQLLNANGLPTGHSARFTSTSTLSLYGLTPGIYMLQITQESTGVTVQRQLIKL